MSAAPSEACAGEQGEPAQLLVVLYNPSRVNSANQPADPQQFAREREAIPGWDDGCSAPTAGTSGATTNATPENQPPPVDQPTPTFEDINPDSDMASIDDQDLFGDDERRRVDKELSKRTTNAFDFYDEVNPDIKPALAKRKAWEGVNDCPGLEARGRHDAGSSAQNDEEAHNHSVRTPSGPSSSSKVRIVKAIHMSTGMRRKEWQTRAMDALKKKYDHEYQRRFRIWTEGPLNDEVNRAREAMEAMTTEHMSNCQTQVTQAMRVATTEERERARKAMKDFHNKREKAERRREEAEAEALKAEERRLEAERRAEEAEQRAARAEEENGATIDGMQDIEAKLQKVIGAQKERISELEEEISKGNDAFKQDLINNWGSKIAALKKRVGEAEGKEKAAVWKAQGLEGELQRQARRLREQEEMMEKRLQEFQQQIKALTEELDLHRQQMDIDPAEVGGGLFCDDYCEGGNLPHKGSGKSHAAGHNATDKQGGKTTATEGDAMGKKNEKKQANKGEGKDEMMGGNGKEKATEGEAMADQTGKKGTEDNNNGDKRETAGGGVGDKKRRVVVEDVDDTELMQEIPGFYAEPPVQENAGTVHDEADSEPIFELNEGDEGERVREGIPKPQKFSRPLGGGGSTWRTERNSSPRDANFSTPPRSNKVPNSKGHEHRRETTGQKGGEIFSDNEDETPRKGREQRNKTPGRQSRVIFTEDEDGTPRRKGAHERPNKVPGRKGEDVPSDEDASPSRNETPNQKGYAHRNKAPSRKGGDAFSDEEGDDEGRKPNKTPNRRKPSNRNDTEYHKRRNRRRMNDLSDGFSENDDDEEKRFLVRPRRRRIYPQCKPRGFATTRPKRLESVRELCNHLMGISCDNDVRNLVPPSEQEIEEYEDGTGLGPSLDPMRPDFRGKVGKSRWNMELVDQFVDQFEATYHRKLKESEREDVGDIIEERLDRLRRNWVDAQPTHEEEDSEDVAFRLQQKDQRNAAGKRRATRRDNLHHDRLRLCLDNRKKLNGSIDKWWDISATMVDKLGLGGMSSDESDNIGGRPVYRIRKRLWRDPAVEARLQKIDSAFNHTNASGTIRPGNPPRNRIRMGSSELVSKRAPVINLPRNWYRRSWLRSLKTSREIRELEMVDNIEV